jgi:hypothetical protein
MQRTRMTFGTLALALFASSTNVPAHATEARQAPGTQTSQLTAADGRISLRAGAVVTRVIDASSGTPIARALVGEARTSFTIQAPGYATLEIALGYGALARRTGDTHASELPAIALCKLGASDKDHDGLCDDAERQYRTDPTQQDTDGDAISDTVELYGEKLEDGTLFDLKALGAIPTHKDVFVRMDWTPQREPSQDAVQLVIDAYANAPLEQLDGDTGINLHLVRGREIPSQGDFPLTAAEIAAVRAKYFSHVWPFPFHYVVFTDWLKGHDASGISPEIPGTNFVIAVAGIGQLTTRKLAGTLMHELGHNLGLQHGGDERKNYKPNYISVMNYLYQFDGIQRVAGDRTARDIDYSRFTTISVNEAALDERKGFRPVTPGEDAPDLTIYDPSVRVCPLLSLRGRGCTTRALPGKVPGAIDFNGRNGPVDPRVVRDLNGNHWLEPFKAGINDWDALRFDGIADPTIRTLFVSDDDEEDDPTCPLPSEDSDVPQDDDPSLDPSISTDTTPAPDTSAPTSMPPTSTPAVPSISAPKAPTTTTPKTPATPTSTTPKAPTTSTPATPSTTTPTSPSGGTPKSGSSTLTGQTTDGSTSTSGPTSTSDPSKPGGKTSPTGTDEPGTDKPGMNEPGTPGLNEPGMNEPGTTEPGTTEPGTPGMNEPGTTEPGTPSTTEPGTPGMNEPGTTEPGTTEPGTPSTTEPGTTEPGGEAPGTQEPGGEAPGTQEPGTGSTPEQPGGEDPGSSSPEDPGSSLPQDPGTADPVIDTQSDLRRAKI